MKIIYLSFILLICINIVTAKSKYDENLEDLQHKIDEEKDEGKKEQFQAKLDMQRDNKAFVDKHINALVNHFYPDPNHAMLVKDNNFEYPTDYEDCQNDLIATWKKYCGEVTEYLKEQYHTLKNLCSMHNGDNDEFALFLKEDCQNN